MKKLLILFFILCTTNHLYAQQNDIDNTSLSSEQNSENIANSKSLPLYGLALQYKQRLDLIQKEVALDFNDVVKQFIDTYTNRKSMYAEMFGKSAYYFPIFEKALKAYSVPEEIKYLAVVESSLNPHAVSRVGATGLWQFMFRTAKSYGLKMNNFEDERKDPTIASFTAAKYLRNSYNELGDWLLAIASYNCGLSNVNKAIEKSGSKNFWELRDYLPAETRDYVPAFIATVYIMNYHKDHQITPQIPIFTFKIDTVDVRHFVSLEEIAKTIHYSEETIFALNPSYKQRIINGTDSTPKSLVIPKIEQAFYKPLFDVLNKDINIDKTVVDVTLDDIYWEQQKRKSTTKALSKTKPRKTILHQVEAGQTLTQIAKKYKVSIKEIKEWNNLNTSNLTIGQLLNIQPS